MGHPKLSASPASIIQAIRRPRSTGEPARSATGSRRIDALPRLTSLALLGLMPAVVMVRALREHGLGWDFRAYYLGARAYLDGVSPYPAHSLAALAGKQGFVYPAPTAALLAPFTLLPYDVSLVLWLIGSVVSIVVALRILGVRDWRVYGALFLTLPAQESVRLGTLMPVLMLLLALLWRYRDRTLLAAALAAVLAVSKVLLFPLLIWLVASRRFRAAALGSGLAVVVCLLGWLPIHLTTLTSYPALLGALARFEQTFSYSLTSLVVGLGLSSSVATTIAWAAGAALLVFAAAVGRRDDFLGFRIALAASFVLSPIVWGHYYLLLVVPIAVRWPRLSPVWLAAAWIHSDTLALPHPWVWAGLAVVVMLVQLDLVKVAERSGLAGAPRARAALAAGFALVLPAAAFATTADGNSLNATLRPTVGGSSASGAGLVRIDQPRREVCWRIWTANVPSRRVAVAIEGRRATQSLLVMHGRIGGDGQAQGCRRVPRSVVSLTRGVTRRPGRYRLVVAVSRRISIAGGFRGS